MSYQHEKSTSRLWEWVKAICTIALVGVFSYKIVFSDFALDTATLLSLLLAFFSIGLSALFYFKATETSNAFYDNTFQYSAQIANLLNEINGKFGERLNSLNENYNNLRNSVENNYGLGISNIGSLKDIIEDKIKEAKQELEVEEDEKDTLLKEKEELIERLIENSNLQSEEKSNISAQLKEKDEELKKKSEELSNLKVKINSLSEQATETLVKSALNLNSIEYQNILSFVDHFSSYISDTEIASSNNAILKKLLIERLSNKLSEKPGIIGFFDDDIETLKSIGWITENNKFTNKGIDILVTNAALKSPKISENIIDDDFGRRKNLFY